MPFKYKMPILSFIKWTNNVHQIYTHRINRESNHKEPEVAAEQSNIGVELLVSSKKVKYLMNLNHKEIKKNIINK